jgi:endonuclease/exonuclease/phosphatase family metal-dependent hydrolase
VPQIQALQAQELLEVLARADMPTIVAGDLNGDSLERNGSPVYGIFADAGFKDSWLKNYARHPAGGLTWGHDADLADPGQGFSWRIDHILYRGGDFKPTAARTLDFSLGSEPPLWPSDHAGLVVQFVLNQGIGRNASPSRR